MNQEDLTRIPVANQNSWKEEIHAEQVKQIYALAPLGFVATVINSLIIFFVLDAVMPHKLLLAWLTAIMLVTVPRILLIMKFRKVEFKPADTRTWKVLFLTGLAGSGVVWGSIGVFPFSGISLAHQVFIAFVLGGMAAGAAATFSALKEGYSAYSIPALTPLAIRFFLVGDAFHAAMGGMVTLYGFLLWRVSRHNYNVNRTSLLLRFENREMVNSLKEAKEQLIEEIGAKLKAEAEIRAHHDQLEKVVEERTADLVRTNEQLKKEIIERTKAEEFLRQSEDRLALAQKAGRVGVFDMNLVDRKVIWTEQLEQLFGLPRGGFEGRYEDWARRIHPDDLPLLEEQFRKWIKESRNQIEFEYRFMRADGDSRWMSAKAQLSYLGNGRPERMIGTNVDITERKRLEEEIMHLAHHDILTGLPNRRLFIDIMNVELAQAHRNRKKLALLFLDLDRFKAVNDTFGHEAGDELLKEISKRLKSGIRESDSAARIGGDEFNIVLADVSRAEDIMITVRKIMDSLKTPFKVAGYELHITTSIGISIYPDDSTETDTLFRYADIAMYHAKESGRNTFQFYNHDINIRSFERIRFESYLRQAVSRGELVLYYQPQFNIKTERIVCAEALVRWQHPDLGFLEPKRFIPMAEEIGFITNIDDWVLRMACERVRRWMDGGLTPVCITVNLSPRQFQRPDLVNNVAAILRETGISPAYLDLEITETMAMRDITQTAARFEELADMGVHISIDDFGTGFSSLNYLKRLPIQKLKIDQSFIRDLATDAYDRAIIRAVTSMAHSMEMMVIAEGVETKEQLSFLNEAECDEAQGFLFSRPLPDEDFEKLLAA